MLLAVIIVLWSAMCRLATCLDSRGSNVSDVSRDATYLSAAYYVNWAIYDRKFDPQDLPVDKLMHVLYAFASILSTGEISLSDTWADTKKHFAGDSWNETGSNLYGCFKQFYFLKKANRHVKVLLSIGGSSYSTNFSAPASTDLGRTTFASTAVSLVADLGLDGLDIDWEFPQDDTEAANMVLLLKSIRTALDAYGDSLSTPYHFQLTVTSPAGPSNYQTLHLAEMDQYIDFWFLMAYNYARSWSRAAGNQANLFPSASDPVSTPFDTTDAISYYIARGVPARKIVLGMPLYGQSFAATDGLGEPFDGVGAGTWEAGLYDFKALPLRGATEFHDSATGSSYSYDAANKLLVSYDNVAVAKQKATFIQQMDLGGAMWWESSADKVSNDSLIQNLVAVLNCVDGSGLDNSLNQLLYPNSTYDNIRAGMPGSNSSAIISSTMFEVASVLSKSVQSEDGSPGSSLVSTLLGGMDSSLSGTSTPTQFTALTVHTTIVSTIINCVSTVKNCPAHSTVLTTLTIVLSTTICPVTESISVSANSTSRQSFSEASQIIQSTTFTNFDTVSSSPTEIQCTETSSTSTTTKAVSEQNTQSGATSSIPTSSTSYSNTSTASFSLRNSSFTLETSSFASSPTSSTSISSTSSIFSTSSSTSEASGSGCQIGKTCATYDIFTCPGGSCFCGLDANNNPTCFSEYTCLKPCTINTDCGSGEACLIKSCCPAPKLNCNLHNFQACHIYTGGSTCAPLAAGCPNSS